MSKIKIPTGQNDAYLKIRDAIDEAVADLNSMDYIAVMRRVHGSVEGRIEQAESEQEEE